MARRTLRRTHRRWAVEALEPRLCLSGPDGFEVDDTWSQAKDLPTSGVLQLRSIHTPSDLDWAKFTLGTPSKVTVATDGPTGDTQMWLYSASNTSSSIAYDDDLRERLVLEDHRLSRCGHVLRQGRRVRIERRDRLVHPERDRHAPAARRVRGG
ncbi:MAG: PPC domain-containing protein [Isosphaeraceae bacterium]